MPGLHSCRIPSFKFACNVECPSVLQRKTSPFLHHKLSTGTNGLRVTTPITATPGHPLWTQVKVKNQGPGSRWQLWSQSIPLSSIQMKPMCTLHPASAEIEDNIPIELRYTISPKRIEVAFPIFLGTASNRLPVATVGWPLLPLTPRKMEG